MSEQESTGEIDLRRHTQLAFATPVVGYQWPDSEALNTGLSALILQREQSQAGATSRSSVGGWQSGLDLFAWGDEAIGGLKQRLESLLGPLLRSTMVDRPKSRIDYRVDGWANVLRQGQYNTIHNHPGALWSGVYYVRVGQPDRDRPKCGDLEFVDPRSGANMVSPGDSVLDRGLRLRPSDGFMVLFPGWLQHFVHPYFGPGERITVAFNIVCSGIQPLSADDEG